MKKLFTILILVLLSITTFAQSPQKMSYQAVIRDANANLVTNQVVGMRLSVIHGSASGTVVYAETQTSTTNTNGLLSIELGGGNVISGDFALINWANGPYFIKTETDPTGGINYTITGTSQFLSVPYALYALNSAIGPQGIQGPKGDTGSIGPQGIPGVDGKTVLNGTNDPSAGIGSNGDFYINTSSNKIFGPKTSGIWGNGVNLVGPQGIQGLTGATGPQGQQGIQGIAGLNGTNGQTVLNGTNDPSAGIGSNGDFYINTSSNKIFGPKTSGVWGNGVNLFGPQGIQGLTGATGPQGVSGLDGKTVLNGTIDPSAGIGSNGDFYINTSSNKIFGPKTSGVWGNGVNLVGPQGIQGLTGATGPQGVSGLDGKTVLNGTIDPSAGIGSNGDFYINTSSNKIFGPKSSGVWGNGTNLVSNDGIQSKIGTGHLIVVYTNTNAYAFSSNYDNWYPQYLSGSVIGSVITNYSAVIYTNNYAYAFNIHLTTSGMSIYASWTSQSLSGTVLGSFSSPYGIVVYTNNYAYGFCSRTNNWYVQSLSGTFKGITSNDSSIIIYTNNYAYAFNVFAYGGYNYSSWSSQSLNGTVQKALP